MKEQLLCRFFKEDEGQDLVEYSLLLASIALAGAAVYIGMAPTIGALWSVANSRLTSASN
jgi:Flp pilus assembly pilin Flp